MTSQHAAGPASAGGARHPLDPLTADEIRQRAGFTLRPVGFFDANPSLDVAPPTVAPPTGYPAQ